MKPVKFFGLLILGLLILGLLFPSKKAPVTSGSAQPPIEYQVVQEWKIPAGGYGRVIVIDSAYRIEAEMRRLGEQLSNQDADARHVYIEVYDDLGAAHLRQAGVTERLPKAKQGYHDRHRVGVYNRNRGTGWNSWVMALEGMQGDSWPHIEVKY